MYDEILTSYQAEILYTLNQIYSAIQLNNVASIAILTGISILIFAVGILAAIGIAKIFALMWGCSK
jgi:hypothetical protein